MIYYENLESGHRVHVPRLFYIRQGVADETKGLRITELLELTDFSDEEVELIMELTVGEAVNIGNEEVDLVVGRER